MWGWGCVHGACAYRCLLRCVYLCANMPCLCFLMLSKLCTQARVCLPKFVHPPLYGCGRVQVCLGLGVHPPGSTAHVGCIPSVNDVCLHVGCTPSFVPETCYHPFTHLYPIQCAHIIIVITSLLILLIYITHPVSLSLSPPPPPSTSPPPPSPPTTPSPLHTGSCTSARQAPRLCRQTASPNTSCVLHSHPQ